MNIKIIFKSVFTYILTAFITYNSLGWGFYAHKMINHYAVFTLPPEMITFYKKYINIIRDTAVNPDLRRQIVKGEATKHYIDIDFFGANAFERLPKTWRKAVDKFGKKILEEHGTLPWNIYRVKDKLTLAFKNKNIIKIIKLSADLGHYVGDANVPLHTTSNYNGQFTNQEGIHAFWESRIPELFFHSYSLFVGKAEYLSDTQKTIWGAIKKSNSLVDHLLSLEKQLSEIFPSITKFSFEQKGASISKVYSIEYSSKYNIMLNGQVEEQLRSSIKMTGDFWYTCWVDAGRPNLGELINIGIEEKKLIPPSKKEEHQIQNIRYHE